MLDQPTPVVLDASVAIADTASKRAATPAGRGWLHSFKDALWPWRWRAPMIAAAAAAAVWLGTPVLFGPAVIVDPVIRADFIQTVVASGHVEAPFRVNIGAQITGVVASIPVEEGQAVKAGQTLIVLDDKEARAAVIQAEGAVAQAEARMRQLRELTLPSAEAALIQANATLLNAEQAYERAAKLAKDGFGTKATLDDATRALDIARAQVKSAEFQVYTNRPDGSDNVMAKTQLDQTAANLATARSRLAYTVITAPRDGVLISRDVERGNVVQPSNVLMKLSPSGEAQLVVLIDERNLGVIAVGQKALASADAFANQKFPTEVVYVNPGIDLQRASVEVKLHVPDPPLYLRQDMTVSVDVEVARRPNTLIVPAADIHDLGGAKPWVLKAVSGRAVRQPVNLGIVSGGKAEILEGLTEGDAVIPASGNTIKAGRKVRSRIAATPAS